MATRLATVAPLPVVGHCGPVVVESAVLFVAAVVVIADSVHSVGGPVAFVAVPAHPFHFFLYSSAVFFAYLTAEFKISSLSVFNIKHLEVWKLFYTQRCVVFTSQAVCINMENLQRSSAILSKPECEIIGVSLVSQLKRQI